jgi:hypothetical protein
MSNNVLRGLKGRTAHVPMRSTLLATAALTAQFALLALPSFAQTPPPPPPPPPDVEPTTPVAPPPGQQGTTPPPPPEANPPTPTGPNTTGAGGRWLLLPDISLNGIFSGQLSNDKRDMNRNKFRLDEAELGIQSFVYPGIRLDTFTIFTDGEAFVEEAYLTFQNVSFMRQNFSVIAGRRKSPWGRVNQLHPHSWLYIVQPYVLSNLVSQESLTGDGAYLSYLLPTKKIFAQLDLGYWSQSEESEDITTDFNPSEGIITSPGAGFEDRYQTVRLWTAAETMGGHLELGGSVAYGRGVRYDLPLGNSEEGATSVHPTTTLSGLDLTYRRAGRGASRLLLRSEYVHHQQKDGSFKRNTEGFYVSADQRISPFNSFAVRYDESAFPFAPGKERGISLIGTHQITEATLFRAQLIHGSRPGQRNFDELHFQLIFGVGPHTHNLE